MMKKKCKKKNVKRKKFKKKKIQKNLRVHLPNLQWIERQ